MGRDSGGDSAQDLRAFFATKPPGKGIGLGLDIIYNIVVNEHRGDIMFSKSGSR